MRDDETLDLSIRREGIHGLLDAFATVAPADGVRVVAFLRRYRELRARGARGAGRTDFWHPTVEAPAEDETYYVGAATAAAIAGMHTSRLASLRRRGKVRSIGMTAGEYKRARGLASWGDTSGWGPGVWYLREDVERLAREGRRAA